MPFRRLLAELSDGTTILGDKSTGTLILTVTSLDGGEETSEWGAGQESAMFEGWQPEDLAAQIDTMPEPIREAAVIHLGQLKYISFLSALGAKPLLPRRRPEYLQ